MGIGWPWGGAGSAAFALGLDSFGFDTDDLDALLFDDADGTGSITAPDTLYFSERRGSLLVLAGVADSCFGIPIEEGDILSPPSIAGAPPCMFIAAEALDLGTLRSGSAGPFGPDDLDALDAALLPEPGFLWQLGGGVALLAALRRRRSGRSPIQARGLSPPGGRG